MFSLRNEHRIKAERGGKWNNKLQDAFYAFYAGYTAIRYTDVYDICHGFAMY